MHMLLQILEEGRLTDGLGRTVDFRNTIIIMTSNIGGDLARRGGGLGFAGHTAEADYATLRTQILEAAKRSFRPELLNRVEEVIVFRSLQKEDVRTILEIEVAKVATRLKSRGIVLTVMPSTFDFLMEKGYDRAYGARQLRRAVEHWLENVLAEEILRGKIEDNEIVEVEAGTDSLEFHPPKCEMKPSKAKKKSLGKPAKKAVKKPAKKAAPRKKKIEGEG